MNKSAILCILMSLILSCSNSSTDINSQIQEDTIKVENQIELDNNYFENENLDSLDYDYYVKFTNPDSIGYVQHLIDSDLNESFINYLGPIYCADRDLTYDVITNFDLIQVADGHRGNSKVIFLGKNKKTCRIFYLDIPDELPIFIKDNEFIFYVNGDTIKENFNECLLPFF
jgi:hypothetical protein